MRLASRADQQWLPMPCMSSPATATDSAKPKPARYKTTNWRQYNAALKHRGSLLVWIDPNTQWYANKPNGRPGRDQIFSDAAIQCCLSLRCLFGLGLRQTIGLVEGLVLAHRVGMLWHLRSQLFLTS
jgi:hypothetical protein